MGIWWSWKLGSARRCASGRRCSTRWFCSRRGRVQRAARDRPGDRRGVADQPRDGRFRGRLDRLGPGRVRAKYLRKADGEFEARLVALSCGDQRGALAVVVRLADGGAVRGGVVEGAAGEGAVLATGASKPVKTNLNTHRPGALYETFEPAEAKALWDRFEFVHTPTHGSWLNVADRTRPARHWCAGGLPLAVHQASLILASLEG